MKLSSGEEEEEVEEGSTFLLDVHVGCGDIIEMRDQGEALGNILKEVELHDGEVAAARHKDTRSCTPTV